jgi:PAS domain S-box-containing protein
VSDPVAAHPASGIGLFEVLLDNAPLGAYLIDASFRIIAVNRAARPVFGDADVVGEDFGQVMRKLWPSHYADEVIARFRHTLVTGESHSVPERVEVRLDLGHLESYEWQINRLRLPDGGFGVVCYFRDISSEVAVRQEVFELAREPDRLRRLYDTILSATPDLVYVFGLDHRFTYANAALLRMWGRTWEEAIGRNCLELGYEPWHAAMHDREIEQVVATRRPIRGEVPFTGTNGRRIYDYIFVPIIGPDGEVEAVTGTTRDVTSQRQAADEVRALADSFAEADRRKSEFLALLAHELRNPLAPIVNALQIMRLTGGNGPMSKQAFDVLERQVKQMVRLVDDLLDVNRISRGKIELQRDRIDLAEPVRMALEATRPIAEARRQRIVVEGPDEPLVVEADAARLVQVFGNLFNNACKFGPEGGQVVVQVTSKDGMALVCVRDEGVGIAAEQLPRIFEMFAQVEEPLVRTNGGLGIGLALVRGLVDMHGGSVTAHSAGPGQGSEFHVRLPLFGS